MTEPRSMTIKVGYEQFVPPRVPPGMWFDPDTWLILPQGVRSAAKVRVAASFFLAIGLFIGLLLNGELLMGPLIWLGSRDLNSVGGLFATTRVLHDPDQILPRFRADHAIS